MKTLRKLRERWNTSRKMKRMKAEMRDWRQLAEVCGRQPQAISKDAPGWREMNEYMNLWDRFEDMKARISRYNEKVLRRLFEEIKVECTKGAGHPYAICRLCTIMNTECDYEGCQKMQDAMGACAVSEKASQADSMRNLHTLQAKV